jgi:hypothetical protein
MRQKNETYKLGIKVEAHGILGKATQMHLRLVRWEFSIWERGHGKRAPRGEGKYLFLLA